MILRFTASAALVLLFTSLAFAQTPVATQKAGEKTSGFQPDISVNALMLYQNSNRGNQTAIAAPNGLSVQEAEIQFFADVDPYHKFTGLFSISQEFDPVTKERKWGIEPEELFAESTDVPYLTLRGGKFKTAFGKHNLLHTHAYPFIDAPVMNTVLLGDGGLNDVGVSAAGLIPVSWFSEFTLQALKGSIDGSDAFNSQSANDSIFVGHFKNLWDFTDDLTYEFGVSGVTGHNEFVIGGENQQGNSNLLGADSTFKWRPSVGGKYHALIWSTEWMTRKISRPGDTYNEGQGFASWIQYQFAERWWVQARGEYLKMLDTNLVSPIAQPPHRRKYTALFAFLPSEFSGYRLQYSYLEDGQEKPEHKVLLQANFTIGAHPAHAY
jgi:hypothetical protein